MEIEKIKYWINDHPTALKKSAIQANLYKPCKKLFEENAQAALETDYLWKLLSFPNKPLFVLIYQELRTCFGI